MTPCTEKSIFRSHIHVFIFGTKYTKFSVFLTCLGDYLAHYQNVISHSHKNQVLQIN